MLANDPQLVTLMLITTCAGVTMLLAGMKKRRLHWRTDPRDRRKHDRRRPRFGSERRV